jgi:hypothetical protein
VAAYYLFGKGEEAGKLTAERVCYDNDTMLRQMRGEVGAPTGVGLAARQPAEV